MENNNLDFISQNELPKRKDSDFVPGFGATPRGDVEALAKTERVGNIEVNEFFDIERLNDLKKAVAQNRDIFRTVEELEKYNGFVTTIEKILRAREALKKAEEERKKKLN